jgi:uncharacterized protein with FMN-binding domain
MKKYFQITSVLVVFGLLVLFRQYGGSDAAPVIGKNQTIALPTQTSTSTPTPSQAPQQSSNQNTNATPIPTVPASPTPQGIYKNGTYVGSVQDAFYGNLQVQAVITGGKLTDVVFLQYPSDNRTSQYVNSQALPMLKQEAIAAQSANVNAISGASASSPAFIASLTDALAKAKP